MLDAPADVLRARAERLLELLRLAGVQGEVRASEGFVGGGALPGVGLPSSGLRACRWMMAAPASAAATDCSAISVGVIGRYGDIVGVWMEPVTAHEMMTLSRLATMSWISVLARWVGGIRSC